MVCLRWLGAYVRRAALVVGRKPGALLECFLERHWTTVLFQQIAKRFVGELLKIHHAIATQEVQCTHDVRAQPLPICGLRSSLALLTVRRFHGCLLHVLPLPCSPAPRDAQKNPERRHCIIAPAKLNLAVEHRDEGDSSARDAGYRHFVRLDNALASGRSNCGAPDWWTRSRLTSSLPDLRGAVLAFWGLAVVRATAFGRDTALGIQLSGEERLSELPPL